LRFVTSGGCRKQEGAPVPKELDVMVCRSCGNEERASEGYPCDDCGTFICLICTMRGITKCKKCREKAGEADNPSEME
jgi:hypothetical protein